MHTHVDTYMHTYVDTHMHTHVDTYMQTHVDIGLLAHTCKAAHACKCAPAYIYAHIRIYWGFTSPYHRRDLHQDVLTDQKRKLDDTYAW
jgi:hypothetical protein